MRLSQEYVDAAAESPISFDTSIGFGGNATARSKKTKKYTSLSNEIDQALQDGDVERLRNIRAAIIMGALAARERADGTNDKEKTEVRSTRTKAYLTTVDKVKSALKQAEVDLKTSSDTEVVSTEILSSNEDETSISDDEIISPDGEIAEWLSKEGDFYSNPQSPLPISGGELEDPEPTPFVSLKAGQQEAANLGLGEIDPIGSRIDASVRQNDFKKLDLDPKIMADIEKRSRRRQEKAKAAQNLDYERATKNPVTGIYENNYSDGKESFVGKVRNLFRGNRGKSRMIETQNLDYERATKDPDTNIYKHDYSDSKASRKSFVGKARSRFSRNQREAKELEKIRTTTGLSDPTPEFDSRDFFDDGLTYKERLKRSTPVLGAVALVGAALFVSTEKSHVLYNDDNPNGVGISGLNIDGLNISEWGWDGVDINPNGNFGGFFTAGDDYEPTQTPPAYATPIVSTEPSSSPAEQIGTPEVTTKPTTEPTNEAEPTAQPTQTPVPPTEIPVVESSGNSVNTHDNEPENDGGFDESVYETFPEDVTNPKIDESTATVDTDKPSRDEAQDETEVMESEEDDELSPEMIIIPHEGSITGTFQSYVFQKYNIVLDADESYIMYEDIFTPEIFDEVEFYRLNNGDQGIKDSGPAIITVKGQEIIETWLIEQGYLTKE